MSDGEKRVVCLPIEQRQFLDELVRRGDFGTADDVVVAALKAFAENEFAVEHWLEKEVAPVYDEMMAHPERAIPIEEVRVRLHERHLRRIAGGRGQ